MNRTAPKPASLSDASNTDAIRLWEHLHGDRPDWLRLFICYAKRNGDKVELTNPAEAYFRADELDEAVV